jgi:hypothetical protein
MHVLVGIKQPIVNHLHFIWFCKVTLYLHTGIMALRLLVVMLAVAIATVSSYDLSGIHVSRNKFLNSAGQEVILKVSEHV